MQERFKKHKIFASVLETENIPFLNQHEIIVGKEDWELSTNLSLRTTYDNHLISLQEALLECRCYTGVSHEIILEKITNKVKFR